MVNPRVRSIRLESKYRAPAPSFQSMDSAGASSFTSRVGLFSSISSCVSQHHLHRHILTFYSFLNVTHYSRFLLLLPLDARIGDSGIIAIAEALERSKNVALEVLHLSRVYTFPISRSSKLCAYRTCLRFPSSLSGLVPSCCLLILISTFSYVLVGIRDGDQSRRCQTTCRVVAGDSHFERRAYHWYAWFPRSVRFCAWS